MPEYLAPGVYLEEVPSGNRPIEGVSTSTAAFVGVAERGPVDDPTLVTSFADYNRKFGSYLDHRVFTDGRDLLPYAVEGFFVNGGSRLYVTRIAGEDAAFATVDLLGNAVAAPASTTLSQRADAGATTLLIDDGTNIGNGDALLLQNGTRSEYVTAQSDPIAAGARIVGRLHADHGADPVAVEDVTVDTNLPVDPAVDMGAGDATLAAIADPSVLSAGDVIRVSDTGDPNLTEYVTIATDATGDITEPGLLFDHPGATTQTDRVTLADATGEPGGRTVDTGASAGDFMIPMTGGGPLAAGQVIRIGTEFHVVQNVVSSLSIAATPTANLHGAGTPVLRQQALLRVHARHQGVWANSLRIRVRPASTLTTAVVDDVAAGDSPVTLGATFGLSAGSVLEVSRAGANVLRQRVAGVDIATNEVDFAGGAGAALQADDAVASVEFDLIVERLSPDNKVVESEAFTGLGIDPGHNRYAPRIVGLFNRSTGEPESTGESELVRLSDLTMDDSGTDLAGAADMRLAIPFDSVDRQLSGGDDDLGGIDDSTYIGTPAEDPADRTGIRTFENIDEVSIVAAPGRTSQDVQNALINHCELMRYRFAVLDSESNARLRDVQTQRQRYDTTRGALYYPWMTITDQFGRPGDVHYVPPSGHVVGIYARSDNARGVHKAPANEVVRGIRDLRTRLTKGEQDILNPRHINCLRDFSDINRGLRVWGARTLSSEVEWKYINVRRLFLFVEKSVERGLQFAVFEPNSEALWATVKRSISNFLTAVWRDGALEGVKAEEAFFVDVGLSTMSQSDIDNGRLIVVVGIAPVKPAEFVIIRIQQKTREAVS
jgi:Bacteriophage tail sheath protein